MTDVDLTAAPDADPARLEIRPSVGFADWLARSRASIAFTTYQASKLFLIGLNAAGEVSVHERTFGRCMGLGASGGRLWLATLYQLWRFENFLEPGQAHDGHDAVFVPMQAHTTGEVDVHDVHETASGAPVFVVTRFNCLATLGADMSFRPIWKPRFISGLAAEDRCHLNGLAMREGRPAYATCVAASDVAGGWREARRDGGVVIDLASGEAAAKGLSMPHSPRWRDGRLWLLQSGTGELGWIDPSDGRFTAVCALPGFARGMSFVGRHAVIGVSRPRRAGAFEGLALDERLAAADRAPVCAICVVNLETGVLEHELRLEGPVRELYDAVVLPGLRRPMALGLKTDEIRYFIRPGPLPGAGT